MPFLCTLCQLETCYLSAFCPECVQIKRILNVYGRTNILEILETVCIRNNKQQQYKIKDIKNKKEENPADASYDDSE
tara:strand:+ start:155 stop:385 length:231 start_codon:yes stop_codon:yes gene_type:complete